MNSRKIENKYIQPYLRVKLVLERMIDKNIYILDLNKIFGNFANSISKELRKNITKIPITHLINNKLALKILYTHIQQMKKESVKELNIDRIEEILLKGVNEFFDLTPLSELDKRYIFVEPTGELDIPLTHWVDGKQRLTRMKVYDFPHAIRQAIHVLESQSQEIKINEEVINRLERIIRSIPMLGKNPPSEFSQYFIRELFNFSCFLETKKHILKKEAYDMLVGSKSKGALELLENNNWPAALLCLHAVKNRLLERNKILLKMKSNIIEREKKLAKGLEVLLIRNYQVLEQISITYNKILNQDNLFEISRYIIMEIINLYLCDSVGIMIEHKNARKSLLLASRNLRDNDKENARKHLIDARDFIILNYSTLMKSE